jgi:hypothetical protein
LTFVSVSGKLLLAFASIVVLGSGTRRPMTIFLSTLIGRLVGSIAAGFVSTANLGFGTHDHIFALSKTFMF